MCVSRRFTAEVEGAVLRKRVADTQRKAARRRMVTQASHRERSLSDIFVAERPEMIPPTPPQAAQHGPLKPSSSGRAMPPSLGEGRAPPPLSPRSPKSNAARPTAADAVAKVTAPAHCAEPCGGALEGEEREGRGQRAEGRETRAQRSACDQPVTTHPGPTWHGR